ncbi:hypothetical protein SAY87_020053 [Trapa incisa]|uniref:VQ domain-containing protein n=1 Tax=Trapa incisa TaxID=236973 RepID=A0AAN7K6P8_9MYRT|nr:hypothetical protein SAY87_020053 [Trapa incisa]
MSPTKSHDQPSASRIPINGARPLPLKISNGSHLIQKPCSNSSSNISFSSSSSYLLTGHALATTLPKSNNYQKRQQKKQPVIIYTESPKVIHTRASEFMALVQKLTGYSWSDENKESSVDLGQIKGDNHQSDLNLRLSPDVISHIPDLPSFQRDIPLLTPSSMNLFLSPHSRLLLVPDAGGGLMSPSMVEFMNGLQKC